MQKGKDEPLSQILRQGKACCVVISCGEPQADGRMDVEMSYEGDPVLAAYLLDSARHQIEQELEGDPDLQGLLS